MARPRKQAPITTAAEIYQDKEGVWHGWVEFPRKPDGTRDRRQRKGKNETKVREKVAALEKLRDEKKRPPTGGGLTVEEWFTEWLADIAPFGTRPLAPSTLDDYWSKCRTWVFTYLGGVRLDDLDTDDLDAMYKAMREKKKSDGTILKVHAIVRRGLSVAIQRRKIMSRINVAGLIDNPGQPAIGRQDVDTTEVHAILNAVEARPTRLRWWLGLAVGPRQSTVLALRWRYVDFENERVDLSWQIQRRTWQHGCEDPHACGEKLHMPPCPGRGERHSRDGHDKRARGCPPPCPKVCARHGASCPKRHSGGLVFSRPKGFSEQAGSHWVAVPSDLMRELRLAKIYQDMWKADVGEEYEDNDLVFCQDNGRPIGHNADRADLRQVLEIAGLSHRGTHWMRHFAATYVVEQGESVEVAQQMLNHKDPGLTRRVYARNAKGLTERGAVHMQGLFAAHGAKRGAGLATPAATPAEKEGPDLDAKAS